MKILKFYPILLTTEGAKLEAVHKAINAGKSTTWVQHLISRIIEPERKVSSPLFLNDIRLTDHQRKIFQVWTEIGDQEKLAAVKNKEWTKWTDKDGNYVVPYFFDADFPGTARLRVKKALKVGDTKKSSVFVDQECFGIISNLSSL